MINPFWGIECTMDWTLISQQCFEPSASQSWQLWNHPSGKTQQSHWSRMFRTIPGAQNWCRRGHMTVGCFVCWPPSRTLPAYGPCGAPNQSRPHPLCWESQCHPGRIRIDQDTAAQYNHVPKCFKTCFHGLFTFSLSICQSPLKSRHQCCWQQLCTGISSQLSVLARTLDLSLRSGRRWKNLSCPWAGVKT